MAVTEEHLKQESVAGRKLTEEEFLALPDDGRKYELVDGEAKEVPTGGLHGYTVVTLIGLLIASGIRKLGALFDSSTGSRMKGGNIRSPDVAFMRWERLPEGEVPVGFIDGAPDVCVEVISPSEGKADIGQKVGEYFDSGAQQVWHVFPETKRVVIYRSLDNVQSYGADEELDAGDILPGFRYRVAELFAVPSPIQ